MTKSPGAALAAAAIVVAVGAVLVSFQPLRSPWWTYADDDAAYTGASLSLIAGKQSRYFDHPGTPIEQALGATLEGRWLVTGDGSRAEQSAAWFANLDATRWAFRGWALVFFFGSALAMTAIVGLMFRDAWKGAAGGLLFLAAPQVAQYSIELRPDVVIGPLCAGVAALLVAAVRRRSGLLFLAAAVLIGLTITVKLHAVGLLVPLGIALALRRPQTDWAKGEWTTARGWLLTHRRATAAAVAAWLVLIVLLNIGSAGGSRAKAVAFVVAVFATVAICVGLARYLPRRRLGSLATLLPALIVAALAGFVLPNLFYAGMVPTMSRWVASGLMGRGVNSDASPLTTGLGPLAPWAPYAVLALVGLVRGLRAGDRTVLIWGGGAAAMAALAAARFATPHYFTPAIALAIPLVIRAVSTPGRTGKALLAVAVVALVWIPYRDGARDGRAQADMVRNSSALVGWARNHSGPGDAVLSTIMDGDIAYRGFIEQYATDPPPRSYRVFSADADGAAAARNAGLRIRYLVDPAHAVDVAALGLHRVESAPGAPHGVDVVTS